MIPILSYGAGVQSSTILLMAIKGEIAIEHAIFADTGWESPRIYDYLNYVRPLAEAAGITMHFLDGRNIRQDAIRSQVAGKGENGHRWASMPLFTKDRETGSFGMIRRQCTGEYKIEPINKRVRQILRLKPRQWWPKGPVVRKVYGISAEESHRTRDPEKWATNHYPLIEKDMTRLDCLAWIERNGYRRPVSSSCIGCAFHSDEEWQKMKSFRPEEFCDAVEFDKAIRVCEGMRSDVFLHRSREPLSRVTFDTDRTRDMFAEDCFGLCGT